MASFTQQVGLSIKDVTRTGEVQLHYEPIYIQSIQMLTETKGTMFVSNDLLKVGDRFNISEDLVVDIASIDMTGYGFRCEIHLMRGYPRHFTDIKFPLKLLKAASKPNIQQMNESLHKIQMEADRMEAYEKTKDLAKYGELNYHVDWDNITTWIQIPF